MPETIDNQEPQPKKEVLNLKFFGGEFYTHFETSHCDVFMTGITEELFKHYQDAILRDSGRPFKSIDFTTNFNFAQGIAGMDDANANITIVEGSVIELFKGAVKIVGLADNKAKVTIA